MYSSIHFVAQNFPVYGITDGRVSGRTVSLSSCSSCGPFKILTQLKTAPVKCASRMSIVCNLSGENKRGFARNRNNWKDDETDGFESLDESDDILSSKNGTTSFASNPRRNQSTSNQEKGERILELFRNIRTQLRERAAGKGEKKTTMTTELNQPHGKDDGSLGEMIEVLKGKGTKKGKTGSSNSGSNRGSIVVEPVPNGTWKKEIKSTLDSMLDQSEQYGSFGRKLNLTSSDSRNNLRDKAQGHGRGSPTSSRPVSKFQRRSPIPQVKHQPMLSDSVTDTWVNGKSEILHPDPETNDSEVKMESESGLSEGIGFDGMLEEEDSEILDGYSDEEVEEEKQMIDEDLSGMKLQELRALAKSRGLKGFSRLKKHDLVELLSAGGSS